MVVSYYKHPGEVLYRQKETYTRDSLTFKQARAKYIWISESLFFSNDDSVPVAAPYSSCRFLLICKYLLVVWRECKRNFFVKATPFARDGQFFKKQKYAVWVTGRIWGAHIDPNPIPPPLFLPPGRTGISRCWADWLTFTSFRIANVERWGNPLDSSTRAPNSCPSYFSKIRFKKKKTTTTTTTTLCRLFIFSFWSISFWWATNNASMFRGSF